MHPLPEEEDLNLICGMEDEMLKRQRLYVYNKQTRTQCGNSHVEHVMLGDAGDDVRAYCYTHSDEFGQLREQHLANVPTGLCHYSPHFEAWVRPKIRLLFLPDVPPSIGI